MLLGFQLFLYTNSALMLCKIDKLGTYALDELRRPDFRELNVIWQSVGMQTNAERLIRHKY